MRALMFELYLSATIIVGVGFPYRAVIELFGTDLRLHDLGLDHHGKLLAS